MPATSHTQDLSKRIPWRKRGDLQSVLLDFEGHPVWGLKDPVTLGYYELGEEAYFVLNQLNGQATWEGICEAFHNRFRPRTLSIEELRSFLGQLLSQSLLLAEGPGHGARLVEKSIAAQSRRRWMQLASLLAIRFRGVNPDALLSFAAICRVKHVMRPYIETVL